MPAAGQALPGVQGPRLPRRPDPRQPGDARLSGGQDEPGGGRAVRAAQQLPGRNCEARKGGGRGGSSEPNICRRY